MTLEEESSRHGERGAYGCQRRPRLVAASRCSSRLSTSRRLALKGALLQR